MRPLTPEERQDRRDRLADLAADLFGTLGWTKLTVDAVASAAGVAKGSVFLSFASKEDLVLHAVARRFQLWFDRLQSLDPNASPETLSRAVLGSVRADALLLSLLALLGPVLEVGCSAEAVVTFKERLAVNLHQLGASWSVRRPEVDPDRWAPLFLRVYALVVGAWVVGEASNQVREALADRPDLQGLLTRFDDLVVPMLEAELRFTLSS